MAECVGWGSPSPPDSDLRTPRRGSARRSCRSTGPQFRSPVDPDLCPLPSAEFRTLRHDGGRAALCCRRQGRQALGTGHLPPWRRLLRPERDGARYRGATNCRCCASSASTAAGPPTPNATSPAATSVTFATTRWPRALGCYAEYVEQPEDSRPVPARPRAVTGWCIMPTSNWATSIRSGAGSARVRCAEGSAGLGI